MGDRKDVGGVGGGVGGGENMIKIILYDIFKEKNIKKQGNILKIC